MLLIAACADGGGAGDPAMDDDMATDEMEAMGDMAEITVAAEARVDTLPSEPRAWVGYRVAASDSTESHSWGPAFVYADDETHELEVDGTQVTLDPGEAVFLEEGSDHVAMSGDFWAFLLTDPEGDPAEGLQGASREFSSGALEGLPDAPADVRFLLVDLPPEDGQTSVHTHPGPEYIYVAEGTIEYETGLEGTTELRVGDDAPLPADTPVQKRNVADEPAQFWSWFIVDPDDPFSAEASFDRS